MVLFRRLGRDSFVRIVLARAPRDQYGSSARNVERLHSISTGHGRKMRPRQKSSSYFESAKAVDDLGLLAPMVRLQGGKEEQRAFQRDRIILNVAFKGCRSITRPFIGDLKLPPVI